MDPTLSSHDFGAAEPKRAPIAPPRPPHEHVRPAINPDPKAHPLREDSPTRPPEHGTDPRQPVLEPPPVPARERG
jgi:hypothetical protein